MAKEEDDFDDFDDDDDDDFEDDDEEEEEKPKENPRAPIKKKAKPVEEAEEEEAVPTAPTGPIGDGLHWQYAIQVSPENFMTQQGEVVPEKEVTRRMASEIHEIYTRLMNRGKKQPSK